MEREPSGPRSDGEQTDAGHEIFVFCLAGFSGGFGA